MRRLTPTRRGKFINNSAFTLIEILIALGISSICILALTHIFMNLAQVQQRTSFLVSLSQIRLNFQQTLMSTPNWKATIAQNPAMSCFAGTSPAPSGCINQWKEQQQTQDGDAGHLPALSLYRAGSSVPLNDAHHGFTMSGVACTLNSDSCTLKPMLTWQLQCDLAADPKCFSPLIAIDLSYKFSGTQTLRSINWAAYGFHVVIPTFPMTLAQPCANAMPTCTPSQMPICTPTGWTCEEFGL